MLDLILPLTLLFLLFVYLYRLPSALSHSHTPPTHHLSFPFTSSFLPSRFPLLLLSSFSPSSTSSLWTLTHTNLSVSVSTPGLNSLPRRALAFIPTRVVELLRGFYALGAGVGALGLVAAVGGTVWAWAAVWIEVWAEAKAHAEAGTIEIIKRAIPIAPVTPSHYAGGGGIQPLIPGVTLPLRHLPTLLLATLLCQIIHEAGHAISAALDGVQPSRTTFAILFMVPQASVSFPSSVDNLPPRAKARLSAAGPWHNLVCWGLLSVLTLSRVGSLMYKDVDGVVVNQVDMASPLYGFLQPGDIITHIDDWRMSSSTWQQYLSGSDSGDWSRGWCVDPSVVPSAPCEPPFVAFRPTVSSFSTTDLCVDISTLLSPTVTHCEKGTLVQVSPAEEYLRIAVGGDVVLWRGPRRQVLSGVHIGTRSPRFFKSLFLWLEIFVSQLKLVSLSLFLFNLLPLPAADGIQLFCALFLQRADRARGGAGAQVFRHPSYHPHGSDPESGGPGYGDGEDGSADEDEDEELLDGPMGRESVGQRRVRRLVEGTMTATVAGWVGGWAMVALLRSS